MRWWCIYCEVLLGWRVIFCCHLPFNNTHVKTMLMYVTVPPFIHPPILPLSWPSARGLSLHVPGPVHGFFLLKGGFSCQCCMFGVSVWGFVKHLQTILNVTETKWIKFNWSRTPTPLFCFLNHSLSSALMRVVGLFWMLSGVKDRYTLLSALKVPHNAMWKFVYNWFSVCKQSHHPLQLRAQNRFNEGTVLHLKVYII